MRRITIRKPGDYDRLEIEELPTPSPGPGEVLIEVQAIGVNYADCITRMGLYASAKRFKGYPMTPGFEVAGRVIGLGDGVEDLPFNGPVMALTLFDGYTTHAVVPRRQVFPLPHGLTMEQAAAFPTAHLTAWFGLMELARPRRDETVLVHSAAGGVGSVLVQMGVSAGCRVIGVVGAEHKRRTVTGLGAEAVIVKSEEPLWRMVEAQAPDGCEIILDANGASSLRESYEHLAPIGRLVVYGFHSMLPRQGGKPSRLKLFREWLRTPRFDPLRMTQENRSVLAFNLSFLGTRADLLQRGMDWCIGELENGRLRPPEVTRFAFEDVGDAHRALESGETTGKLVLTV